MAPFMEAVPLVTDIGNSVRLRIIQTASKVKAAPDCPPNSIKIYPALSHLASRLFLPDSYEAGSKQLLPLYLNLHGGGFALLDPSADDAFSRTFANMHNVIVISLDYPKAPQNPFPSAVTQLTELVRDLILTDETIPFDHDRVAIGGFSAGGNLSLAIAQDPLLRAKLKGVCAVYAPVNFITTIATQMASRPVSDRPDGLEQVAPIFNWGYIPAGTDLADPKLSVAFAPRDTLPRKLYLIGCEFDMLREDAEKMAVSLAGREWTGSEEAWHQDDVKWEKILGMEHGFNTTMPMQSAPKEERDKRAQEMYRSMGEWLYKEVYI